MPKMRILRKIRQETVVLVPKAQINADGSYGIDTSSAQEIKVRWENDVIEYLNPKGETEQSRAIAYTENLLEIGSFLFRGTLDQFDALVDIKKGHYLMFEVRGHKEIPTLSYGDFLRLAYLGPFN